MKAAIQSSLREVRNLLTPPSESATIESPGLNGKLHCHPELELIYFKKGDGV